MLLLHGYPQTNAMWRRIAPELAERFTVICPDLRGYGDSDKPCGDRDHLAYSKRTMARDQLAAMRGLGYERFGVVTHDRGARVALRMALDHPASVLFSESGIGSAYDVPAIWRQHASDVTAIAVDCGHFIAEERPAETARALLGCLSPDT